MGGEEVGGLPKFFGRRPEQSNILHYYINSGEALSIKHLVVSGIT